MGILMRPYVPKWKEKGLLTSLLLLLADKAKNTNKEVSFVNAVIIGVSQSIAMLPGISRSGATISTSVLSHLVKPGGRHLTSSIIIGSYSSFA